MQVFPLVELDVSGAVSAHSYASKLFVERLDADPGGRLQSKRLHVELVKFRESAHVSHLQVHVDAI